MGFIILKNLSHVKFLKKVKKLTRPDFERKNYLVPYVNLNAFE